MYLLTIHIVLCRLELMDLMLARGGKPVCWTTTSMKGAQILDIDQAPRYKVSGTSGTPCLQEAPKVLVRRYHNKATLRSSAVM